MPFAVGHKKVGGRKRGVSNKQSQSATEIFERFAFNSLEKAIELARDETVDIGLRIGLVKELLKYQFPQVRSQDHRNGGTQLILEDRRHQLVQIFSDPTALKAAQSIAERLSCEKDKE